MTRYDIFLNVIKVLKRSANDFTIYPSHTIGNTKVAFRLERYDDGLKVYLVLVRQQQDLITYNLYQGFKDKLDTVDIYTSLVSECSLSAFEQAIKHIFESSTKKYFYSPPQFHRSYSMLAEIMEELFKHYTCRAFTFENGTTMPQKLDSSIITYEYHPAFVVCFRIEKDNIAGLIQLFFNYDHVSHDINAIVVTNVTDRKDVIIKTTQYLVHDKGAEYYNMSCILYDIYEALDGFFKY